MDHAALDRAGADDGDLNGQIIDASRFKAGQHAHLRARFHLKRADTVGLFQHAIGRPVFLGQGRQIVINVLVIAQLIQGLSDAGQHAKGQDIDLQDTQRINVILVPFNGGAVRHGGIGNGGEFTKRPARDDKTANMLRQMTRKARQFARDIQHRLQARFIGMNARLAHHVVMRAFAAGSPNGFGQFDNGVFRQTKHLADIANGTARSV